ESVLTVDGAGDVFAMIASFGDGWYRVMGWNRRHEVPDDTPLDLEEVRGGTRRAPGTDYGMYEARWRSRFHSGEPQAPNYRRRRRRRLRDDRLLRRRLVPRHGLEPPARGPRRHPPRPRGGAGGHPPRAGHRLRHVRGALAVPLPQ